MIELILGVTFIVACTSFARYQRNKYYSINCPKCGKRINPKTTGLMDSITHITKYKYKCKHCGWHDN